MATLGEMATGIAHELNQPLNVMRMGADYLAKMIKRGEKISEDALLRVSRNINGQVERAATIINRLRDFGRKSSFEVYPVDINEPVADAVTILGEQLKLQDIDLHLKLAEALPKIFADKNRLEQVVLNLVTNAKDAMEGKKGKSTIVIATYQQGNEVVVEVSDTGSGIPEDIMGKIFEPFFTTKEVGKGTGMGLSIVYNIVKDFNGSIDVESTLNEGTTFRLRFPVCGKRGYQCEENTGY